MKIPKQKISNKNRNGPRQKKGELEDILQENVS